jgi:hypothetical protein
VESLSQQGRLEVASHILRISSLLLGLHVECSHDTHAGSAVNACPSGRTRTPQPACVSFTHHWLLGRNSLAMLRQCAFVLLICPAVIQCRPSYQSLHAGCCCRVLGGQLPWKPL